MGKEACNNRDYGGIGISEYDPTKVKTTMSYAEIMKHSDLPNLDYGGYYDPINGLQILEKAIKQENIEHVQSSAGY